MSKNILIRRALLSVANKEGIIDLARVLDQHHVDIIATGGTAALLKAYHLSSTEVSEYTDFPEILQGRVKTLHPKVFGGILARGEQDAKTLTEHQIKPIDLVVANLYPFQEVIQKSEHVLADAIEQIDIGGVSLIRAAAKNFHHVIVLVDPKDYLVFYDLLRQQKQIDDTQRLRFAQKAFQYIAWYDGMIANYFSQLTAKETQTLPDRIYFSLEKQSDLRYGENPHQHAALYTDSQFQKTEANSLTTAKLIQGKPLSYNNLMDANAALECVVSFAEPACVIVKHANPCGAAIGKDLLSAYQSAYKTDPTSAFGGIIALNRELDEKTAAEIIHKQFVEVIITPAIATEAIAILAAKPALRVLITGPMTAITPRLDMLSISGGVLIQDHDLGAITEAQLQFVTTRKPTDRELQDLLFAWHVVKSVKSNAIVYAHDLATLAIGGGQTSRIFSVKSAIAKAQEEGLALTGSVMASDAFFPFRDSVDTAAMHGITAIIQPGGSVRDNEVIAAADQAEIAMVFTGQRHFRH